MARATIIKPFVITVFGASGDLAKLKLFPAIYSLAEQKRITAPFYIMGFARTKKTNAEFRAEFAASVRAAYGAGARADVLNKLLERVYYFAGQYDAPEDFASYQLFLEQTSGVLKQYTHLAYFSVPSSAYKSIIQNLAGRPLAKTEDLRLIIEKPFGVNRASAEEIFHFALQNFREEQFYLLDHYLGKSAVRSILHLRESNRILSHMMRGYEIANIQITAFEDFGVKERASYFDAVGIIKDFVQSHLLQILALATMSLPTDKSAASLQREKHAMLSAIECSLDASNIVIGQYQGYRRESGVPKNSVSPTFVALRLFIDRLDWAGVPVYLRAGKQLGKKQTYVMVELKKFPFQPANEAPNRLIFELHPFEQLSITLVNTQDDPPAYQEVIASHSVACPIGEGCLPPGHAPLIFDALRGEKKYFLSFPEILAAWDLVDHITKRIRADKIQPQEYPDGSSGPAAQHKLTKRDGFSWYDLP